MGRRRTSLLEDLFEALLSLFSVAPAWLCLPLAAIAFLGVRVGLPILFGPGFPIPLAGMAPMLSLVAAGLVLFAGALAAIKKKKRKGLYDRQTSIDSIRTLTWQEFEQLIGEYFRRQGYFIEETGGGGADGGIDLKLFKGGQTSLVQCKQWRVTSVGVKPLRELYGVLTAEKADRAVFVTSGVYTEDAKAFAAGKPLELIDGDDLCRALSLSGRTHVPPASPEIPACPLCDRPMVRRFAKKGPNAGSRFWGCPSYPRCNGTRKGDAYL